MWYLNHAIGVFPSKYLFIGANGREILNYNSILYIYIKLLLLCKRFINTAGLLVKLENESAIRNHHFHECVACC